MSEHADPPPADDLTPKLTPADAERLARERMPFAPGHPVPNRPAWTLVKELGSGGFGVVWQARHEWKSELAAVKFCTHPDARVQLVSHEKKVIVRVMRYAGDHPHIVPLLDYDLEGEVPWLMYEYVEGGTLIDAMHEWRDLPVPRRLGRAVLTLYGLARALKRVHRLDPPIVHRDLKPANILMTRGLPRVTDFGIGGAAMHAVAGSGGPGSDHSVRLPTMLKAMGTSRYASPEQMFGSLPDPRDDVYALGVIAYQLALADLKVAPGTDAADILRDLKAPKEFISLVVRSVAMDPDRRPKNAREWEHTLRAWVPRKAGTAERAAIVLPPANPRTRETPRPEPEADPLTRAHGATPTPPPAARAEAPPPAPKSDAKPLALTVPGALLARPADEPDAGWKEVVKTPADVVFAPSLGYCVRVKERAADRDLEGLQALAGLACVHALNLAWCEQLTDAGLAHAKDLVALRSLDLMGCKKLTNAALAHLRGMTALESLNLRWCALVTDAGLARLVRLVALRSLDLMGCGEVTDAGIAQLKGFTRLRHLNLRWCEQVTDAGLAHLSKLPKLRSLSLWNCTQVTDAGVAALKDALPKCQVER